MFFSVITKKSTWKTLTTWIFRRWKVGGAGGEGGGVKAWKERGGGVFEGDVDTHGTLWPPLKKSDFSG